MESSEINISLELFSIALYELIDNAFKFSKKNSTVSISVTSDSNQVHISILDQGTTCNAAELRIQSGFIGQIKRSNLSSKVWG